MIASIIVLTALLHSAEDGPAAQAPETEIIVNLACKNEITYDGMYSLMLERIEENHIIHLFRFSAKGDEDDFIFDKLDKPIKFTNDDGTSETVISGTGMASGTPLSIEMTMFDKSSEDIAKFEMKAGAKSRSAICFMSGPPHRHKENDQ